MCTGLCKNKQTKKNTLRCLWERQWSLPSQSSHCNASTKLFKSMKCTWEEEKKNSPWLLSKCLQWSSDSCQWSQHFLNSTNLTADQRWLSVCPPSSEPDEALSADFDGAELFFAANQRSASPNQPMGSRLKQDTSPCNYSGAYCNCGVLLRCWDSTSGPGSFSFNCE